MHHRPVGRIALLSGLLLAATSVMPAASLAQDEALDFPFTSSGMWTGTLRITGHRSTDAVSDDGSFTVKNTDVMGGTSVSVELTIADDGTITGTMPAIVHSFSESAGAASNGDPFHILTDKVEAGTLTLSGTAERFVASGVLLETTNTLSEGELIEQASKTRDREVEWVFSVGAAECHVVRAPLVAATGLSFVGSALLPPEVISGGTKINSSLTAVLHLWPTTAASSDELSAIEDEVTMLADELAERSLPLSEHLLALVAAWIDMQTEIAALNDCDPTADFMVSPLDEAWLTLSLQRALGVALESTDVYEASEVIDLWDAGFSHGAMNGELIVGYLDALNGMLDAAIEFGDATAIADILAFADANGFAKLKAKAEAASG